ASGPRSFGLGLLLAGANPKSVVLAAASVTSIIETGAHGATLVLAIGAFVLIGSCSVVGAVLAKQFGGERATAFLDGIRGFMLANNAVIMAVVFVILGAKILGDGISGLGS
ncbi:MAG: GAP family protein, partial [Thermomicrobiales bacterium]|nr:GAP family protein [Thermomicrobiales bacterium]